MAGRYGPYVTDGTTNATLPRAQTPEELTAEAAILLITEKAAKGPVKKGARKKAAPKKAAPKKASAKKAAAKTVGSKAKAAPKKASKAKGAAVVADEDVPF
jgi:DNA topoisomerase-1